MDDSTTNNFPTGAYKFGTLLVANSGFFGSQYFVPDNFNADPYIYIFGLLVTMELLSINGLKLK